MTYEQYKQTLASLDADYHAAAAAMTQLMCLNTDPTTPEWQAARREVVISSKAARHFTRRWYIRFKYDIAKDHGNRVSI